MTFTSTTGSSIVLQWRELLRWLAICIVLSVLVGSLVAFFVTALDSVTQIHWRNGWLLYFLPFAGIFSGWLYHRYGKDCEAGNSQIYAQVKQCSSTNAVGGIDAGEGLHVGAGPAPHDRVPWQMAPLVFIGTLVTHLFGGSAGREGSAVQIGGAIASGFARWLRLSRIETATILQAGVAAGFGAVFGTPLAAALFAIEVVGCKVARVVTLPVCLFCAIVADNVASLWGIEHTAFLMRADSISTISLFTLLKVVALAVAFGSAAGLFLQSTRLVVLVGQQWIVASWLRPAIGGLLINAIVLPLQWRQYLGLGVHSNPLEPQSVSIVTSFYSGGAEPLSWLWKTMLTAITVGSGFKGGEATPLFFIGATLGSVLGGLLQLPIDLAAGLGFVAVFAAATRAPLACTVMAIELFAQDSSIGQATCLSLYAMAACVVATTVRLGATSAVKERHRS